MLEFFNFIVHFFSVDIYQLIVDAFAYFVEVSTVLSLKATLSSITFAWDIAQSIMQDLHISDYLNQMYSGFNSDVMQILLYMRFPEAINNIMGAYITRYVLSMLSL